MKSLAAAKRCQNRTSVVIFVFTGVAIAAGLALLVGLMILLTRHFPFVANSHVATVSHLLLITIPCYCVLRCCSESLKAIGQTQFAMLLETGAIPAIAIMTLGALQLTEAPSKQALGSVYSAAYFIAAILMAWCCWRCLSRYFSPRPGQHIDDQGGNNQPETTTPPFNRWHQWQALWSSGLLAIIYGQFGLLVLPFFATLNEVGEASAAFRLISLTTTILLLISSLYSPKFAQARSVNELKQLLRQTQYISLLIYTPFALVFWFFPTTVLQLFGTEFTASADILRLLCLAQMINAATGIPGVMLRLTGHAPAERNILIVCLGIASGTVLALHAQLDAFAVMAIFAALIAIKNIVSYGFAMTLPPHTSVNAWKGYSS